MSPRRLTVLCSAFLCLGTAALQGQTIVWSGAGNRFTTGSNWVGGVAPIAGNTAQFGNHGGNSTIMVNSTTIDHLDFLSTRSAIHNFTYDDGTATLTLNGNLTAATGPAVNFIISGFSRVNLALPSGNHVFDIGASTTVSIASVVSGTGHLSKIGAGTLVLSGANTLNYNGVGGFNSGVAVDGGTLELNGGSISQSFQDIIVGSVSGGTGTLIVSNGGDVVTKYGVMGNDSSTNGTITVTGAGSTWTNSQGMALGYLGTGFLNVLAGGTVTTTGSGTDHSYLGLQTGTAGTAVVSGTGSAWTTPNDQLIVGGSGTGDLTISSGGLVANTAGYIGQVAGGAGAVSVNNGTWNNSAELLVGNSGTGTLNITAGGDVTNTYSYIATQSGSTGTVVVDGAGSTWVNSGPLAVGQGGMGALTISNGGAVSSTEGYVGYATGSAGTALVSGSGSTWTNSINLVVGSAGSGTLTLTNAGTVTASGGSGQVRLGDSAGGSGMLNIGAAAANAAAPGGIVNAATITTGATATGTIQFNTTATAGSPYYLTKDGTSGGTFVDVVGATQLVNTAGYTILGGSNTYTGPTTVNGGTLVLSNWANAATVSSIGSSSASAANLVLNGGTLRYTGGNGSTDRLFTLGVNGGTLDISNPTAAGGFTFTNTGSVGLSGTNTARTLYLDGTTGYSSTVYFYSQLGDNGTGATSVVALDGSFWRLAAANTYSGGTTVNNGGLLVAINSTGSATGSGPVTVDSGGRLSIGSNSPNGAIGGNITVNGTGQVEFNRSTDYTHAGVISGTGQVQILGTAGAITLTGANTYTGSSRIDGTLTVTTLANGGAASGVGASSNAASNMIIGNGGSLRYTGAAANTDRLFTIGTGGATISGSGSGALQFLNTGTLAFSSPNTSASLTLAGSTLYNSLRPILTDNGSGVVSLNVTGSGLWFINGANTYTGPTTITGATLATGSPDFGNGLITNGGQASGLGASSSAAANLVLNGGTLVLEGPTASTDRLFTLGTGGGTLSDLGIYTPGAITFSNTGAIALSGTNTARTLTLNGTAANSHTLVPVLGDNGSGASSIVKNGSGTWVLAGANTYTGGTTISAGTLVAATNSALGTGSVTLNGGTLSVASGVSFGNLLGFGVNGGTLAGDGNFTGPLTLGAGVTLAPGNSPGTLNFASGLTLNDGGILEIEIQAPTGTPGTNWDLLDVTGTLNLSGLSTGGYTLKAISLDLSGNPGAVSGLIGPASWTIAITTTINGFQATDFVINSSQFTGGGNFTLSQSGNNLMLNFTPVPEPSTYALMAAGLAVVGLGYHRRRKLSAKP
jgi:fibronectin-binding autotransporter adhesin